MLKCDKSGLCAVALLTIVFLPGNQAYGQQLSSFDRERVLTMLDSVTKDVQKHYYDPKFHGVDWDATVRKAKEGIKSADSLNLAMAHVAQALATLNDSHTFFVPPSRPYVHDYGYQAKLIGDRCFITRVRPGSDAEAKGLRPGDELLGVNGYRANRDLYWKIEYRFSVLRPEPTLQLVARNMQGQVRQVEITATFKQRFRVTDLTGEEIWEVVRKAEREEETQRPRWAEVGDDLFIVKLPAFMLQPEEVQDLMNKARKRSGLILDLRGNPGGAIDTLKEFLGSVFDKDVKVGDRVGRKESKPEVAKSSAHGVFAGKLVVLLDSRSASAAELFARVIQLEKRGVVVGDRSSGSVMEAKQYSYSVGADVKTFYGAEITEADLIMSDGQSLEHRGVTPDELVLPTAADLAAGLDPVMSRAAALLGVNFAPEAAGKLFPYEWPKL